MLWTGGSGSTAIVFLHGGLPSITPFCSGSHIWTSCLPHFSRHGQTVVAIDLPGAGGSALPGGHAPTLDRQGAQVLAVLRQLSLHRCDVVGHAEGCLIGLWLAMECPDFIRSTTVVASSAAAPSGDLVENLSLACPPLPLWSRSSQDWSLRQLSISTGHIDAPLLDACIAASEGEPHRETMKLASDETFRAVMLASVMKTKARFFAMSRDRRFPAPLQLIWGDRDPLASLAQALALYRFVATTQPSPVLHILGRTGHMPFRERPDAFQKLVTGFTTAWLEDRGYTEV